MSFPANLSMCDAIQSAVGRGSQGFRAHPPNVFPFIFVKRNIAVSQLGCQTLLIKIQLVFFFFSAFKIRKLHEQVCENS